MSIQILIADDHEIVREGLRALIEDEPDMKIVGEAKSGREAVEMAEELRPDVVLMDVGMPDLNGIEAARKITRRAPGVKILALSIHSGGQFVAKMLEAGASGYLLKDNAFEELAAALRRVTQDKTYLCSEVTGPIVEDYLNRLGEEEDAKASPLTSREREVLQLLAEGLISKQIASRLNISPKTVETHRSRLMKKLGIHSVAELTKYAIREGLTTLEE